MDSSSSGGGGGSRLTPNTPLMTASMRDLDLSARPDNNPQQQQPSGGAPDGNVQMMPPPPPPILFEMDSVNSGGDGNHSSEEELEEINKCGELLLSLWNFTAGRSVHFYRLPDVVGCASGMGPKAPSTEFSSSSMLVPSSSSSSSASSSSSPSAVAMMSSTSSAMTTPVEFSMSPPTGRHVHKPNLTSFVVAPPEVVVTSEAAEAVVVGAPPDVAADAFSSRGVPYGSSSRRTISPRKRYKQGRTQHIQRPCLDFEKMQKVMGEIDSRTIAWCLRQPGASCLCVFCLFDFVLTQHTRPIDLFK